MRVKSGDITGWLLHVVDKGGEIFWAIAQTKKDLPKEELRSTFEGREIGLLWRVAYVPLAEPVYTMDGKRVEYDNLE